MELLNNPKPQPEPEVRIDPNHRISKRWRRVSDLSHPNKLRAQNNTIEIQYYNTLKKIKRDYLQPGTLYFERDYRDDSTDPFLLHSFICDQLSFVLTCDFHCVMQIEYDFAGFEPIEDVLWRVGYAKELGLLIYKPRLPNLADFFKSVTTYQGPQFVHTL
jgi:hypothetical protein